MKRSPLWRRAAIVLSAVVLLAFGAGVAYAYWSATGIGAGSATSASSSAFTVSSGTPTGGPLTPGGAQSSVPFTVSNLGSGEQRLTKVTVTVAESDGSTWNSVGGCSAADYTVGTPLITYGNIPGGGSVSGTVSVAMNNLPTNQDGCKNATVPLYFVAS
ncbi:hypothetical protein [Actinophytocola xanthii]|uniref:Uncharacterized protein n=1 Tax=Actinophytocola xanthii TaxID=1912961 RepID=A0A1Q8BU75_9PSEU|nr:hypothetical protein [Actinophytocola xanthii]OLF05657.1 hypothetical protein BU204_36905 [Actinophytocola xanthii]